MKWENNLVTKGNTWNCLVYAEDCSESSWDWSESNWVTLVNIVVTTGSNLEMPESNSERRGSNSDWSVSSWGMSESTEVMTGNTSGMRVRKLKGMLECIVVRKGRSLVTSDCTKVKSGSNWGR